MRAFFALPLGEIARAELSRAVRDFQEASWGGRVRWVPGENLHITLRFLGEIPEDRSDELVERVRGYVGPCAPFACRLASIRPFPSEGRARLIAARVAPEPPLSELHERVERGVVEAGLEADPRRFQAHITLGRARKPPLRNASIETLLAPAPVEVERVVLYRSKLSPDGARYTPLVDIALSGKR
jgi:2'-5' RNA ligase